MILRKLTRNRGHQSVTILLIWGVVLFAIPVEGAELYWGQLKNRVYLEGKVGFTHFLGLSVSAAGTLPLRGIPVGFGPSFEYNGWFPELGGTSDTTKTFKHNGQVVTCGLRMFPVLWMPMDSLTVSGFVHLDGYCGGGIFIDPDFSPWWKGPLAFVATSYLSLGLVTPPPYPFPIALNFKIGCVKKLCHEEQFSFFASLTAGFTFLQAERIAPPPRVKIRPDTEYSNNNGFLCKDNTATISLKLYNMSQGPANKITITPSIPPSIKTTELPYPNSIAPFDSIEYRVIFEGNPFLTTDTNTCRFEVIYRDDAGKKYRDSINVTLVTHADTTPPPLLPTVEIVFPKGKSHPINLGDLDTVINHMHQYSSIHIILKAYSYGAIYGNLYCPNGHKGHHRTGAKVCGICGATLLRRRLDNPTFHKNLAIRRAEYVKKYLIEREISSARIQVRNLGNTVQKNAVEIIQVQ